MRNLATRCRRHAIHFRVGLLVCALWLCKVIGAGAVEPVGGLLDLENRPASLYHPPASKAVVVVFVKTDCPISNRYAPEIRRLYEKFSARGVGFRVVYPDADLSREEIRRHMAEYDYPGPALRDPSHHLVKLCGARVTPEAAVLAPDGHLVYHGRIDDRYVAFGKWRPQATRHDLELAINAYLEDRPVPPSESAVGCVIQPLE